MNHHGAHMSPANGASRCKLGEWYGRDLTHRGRIPQWLMFAAGEVAGGPARLRAKALFGATIDERAADRLTPRVLHVIEARLAGRERLKEDRMPICVRHPGAKTKPGSASRLPNAYALQGLSRDSLSTPSNTYSKASPSTAWRNSSRPRPNAQASICSLLVRSSTVSPKFLRRGRLSTFRPLQSATKCSALSLNTFLTS